MNAQTLLEYLAFRAWKVGRIIDGNEFGFEQQTRSTIAVRLDFYPEKKEFIYSETGRLDGAEVERKYKFRRSHEFKVPVELESGSSFYVLDLSSYPHMQVQHRCESDLDSGTFNFSSGRWESD